MADTGNPPSEPALRTGPPRDASKFAASHSCCSFGRAPIPPHLADGSGELSFDEFKIMMQSNNSTVVHPVRFGLLAAATLPPSPTSPPARCLCRPTSLLVVNAPGQR